MNGENPAGLIPFAEIHELLNEMLQAVDDLCGRHAIRYTLYVGTLLGVIREGDFIPWDDDADLAMPLSDYRRFIEIAEKELPDKYVLQHVGNTPDHLYPWLRIYCRGTTYMHKKWLPLRRHKGIALDIYPMIGAFDNPVRLKLQQAMLRASGILLRADTRRYQYYDRSRWYKDAAGALLTLIPRRARWRLSRLLLDLSMPDPSGCARVCTLDAAPFVPKFEERDWREFIHRPLRGREYPVPAEYDKILRIMYGDYRTPPPESARRGHAICPEELIVDLHRDYTEYERELRRERRGKERESL